MTNKARTIALRDSFMAKQFNRALGVNDEPETKYVGLKIQWQRSTMKKQRLLKQI